MHCRLDGPHGRTDNPHPFISVAIPTFRRPEMLRRAIESVLAQDFRDWELVISDDETRAGPSRALVAGYARCDRRIRLVENRRGRGQVENTNTAMLASAGGWIKLLHDDDWLAAGALSRFADLAQTHPDVAFMTCAANLVLDRRVKAHAAPKGGERVVLCSGQQCLVDLYLLRATRHLGIVPSTLLVNSRHIQNGCVMRTSGAITQAVDQLFYIDLACRGDVVLIHEGLIFYDETSHASIGSSTPFPEIDRETLELKRLTLDLIADPRGLPAPETVTQALQIARLPSRYRRQKVMTTIADASRILRPSVMGLTMRALFSHALASVYGWPL